MEVHLCQIDWFLLKSDDLGKSEFIWDTVKDYNFIFSNYF